MTRRIALLLLLLLAGAAVATAADVTSIEALMERHITAIGGKEALLAVKSLVVEATSSIPARGASGPSSSPSSRPPRRSSSSPKPARTSSRASRCPAKRTASPATPARWPRDRGRRR